jgi:hypothetical protein
MFFSAIIFVASIKIAPAPQKINPTCVVAGVSRLISKNGADSRPLLQIYYPHCALCRNAWSTNTSAVIASIIGTARGNTHGS